MGCALSRPSVTDDAPPESTSGGASKDVRSRVEVLRDRKQSTQDKLTKLSSKQDKLTKQGGKGSKGRKKGDGGVEAGPRRAARFGSDLALRKHAPCRHP